MPLSIPVRTIADTINEIPGAVPATAHTASHTVVDAAAGLAKEPMTVVTTRPAHDYRLAKSLKDSRPQRLPTVLMRSVATAVCYEDSACIATFHPDDIGTLAAASRL